MRSVAIRIVTVDAFIQRAVRRQSRRSTAYQASARGGVVRLRLAGDRIVLGGRAVTVMQATLLAWHKGTFMAVRVPLVVSAAAPVLRSDRNSVPNDI